tara:strand:- start:17 stop:181 length:165 start_codon:yes stop_codon:yes gene_type:complete
MKKVQLTKDEIIMLLHGYDAWAANDGDTEDSGFSKKERKSMNSAAKVLNNILNA